MINRLSRLRRTPALRELTADVTFPAPGKFIWPVFVVEGKGRRRQPIASLPGQSRLTADALCHDLEKVIAMGVRSVMLFGVVEAGVKSPDGAAALGPDSLIARTVTVLRRRFPELTILTDVCLCAYTRHGHCGLLRANGTIDNDRTLEQLADVAVAHALAGADGVAPSAMMDGQVAAIRAALEAADLRDTLIMSYSTKFASALYGPFREAADSAPAHGDRRGYQADPAAARLALRESAQDEAEGADILMVKPALFYLDILAAVRAQSRLPLAAYNVSGEYAMIHACADRGWGNRAQLARESLLAMRRAGADMFLSYWANQYNTL